MLSHSITDTINFIVLIFFCRIVCDAETIDSVASMTKLKGCTEIIGDLIINIRGSGGSGLFIIQPNAIDLSTTLQGVNITNSVLIPQSLILRSLCLAKF